MSLLRSIFVAVGAITLAAGCAHKTESPGVSAAAKDGVGPDLVCVEKKTQVTLKGDGFTPMASKTLVSTELILPAVKLKRTKELAGGDATGAPLVIVDDARDPGGSRLRWVSEQEMAFDVTPDLKMAPGVYDVLVTNPDGEKAASFEASLAGFPRATGAKISPDLTCDEDVDQTLTLTGTGFLQWGTTLPVVRVGTQNVNVTKVDGCQAVPGTFTEGAVSLCTQATFTLAKKLLPPGVYDVSLQNPSPADCEWSDPVKLTLVPSPVVGSVKEDLVCDAQADQDIVVGGTGYLQLGADLPTVTVSAGGTTKTYPGAVDGCSPIPGNFEKTPANTCTSLKFKLPKGDLPPEGYGIVVNNPAPAQAVSKEALYFHVAPPPSVNASAVVKACVANGAPQVSVTSGDPNGDFLRLTDAATNVTYPSVEVNGKTYPATDASGCTEIKLPQGAFREGTVERCKAISFTLPMGAGAVGKYDVLVTNPKPAACNGKGEAEIEIVPPPSVSSVVPPDVCVGGGDITITGADFLQSSTVTLADAAGVQPSATGAGTKVNAAGTQITSNVPGGSFNPGTVVDVVVNDPGGCQDPVPHKKITIKPGPILYWVEPDVVYNGINTPVSMYVTAITGGFASAKVVLKAQVGGATITFLPGAATNPLLPVAGRASRMQIVVPAGTPAGVYDVTFSDALGCPAVLNAGLTVVDAKSIALKNVQRPFAGKGTQTEVQILRDKAAIAPNLTPFKPTPRAWLTRNGAPTEVAIPIGSVSFVDADTLGAVIPASVPVGSYDLVVMNPRAGNEVGVLANALKVTVDQPPTVSAITPSSIINAAGQAVVITGTNFRNGVTASITQCQTAAGGVSPLANGIVTGALTCAGTSCTLGATIDAGNLAAGSVCLARVTNTDGTYADYSGIGVSGSSLNLSAPRAGVQMNDARRALVGASANATDNARFVFAIGGDNGTATTPYKTVESAAVDPFGAIKNWTGQRYDLGTARSFAAGVTVGRYIYLCGGSDGAASLASCRRAMLLNPQEAPVLEFSDATLETTGLAPGYWFYRVSAVFAGTDPENPGGESLPSDEIGIRVPSVGVKKMRLQLSWTPPADGLGVAVGNVASYRVYRTPVVNGISGQEVLLGTTATPTFLDDGSLVPGTAVPLNLGSTGQWAPLPNMSVPRRGLAMSFGFDPVTPNKLYVYSFFGLNAATANDTYEYLPITLGPSGHHTAAAAWTAGASKTGAPRWQVGAFRVDAAVYAPAAPKSYLYVGGGLTAGGATDSTVDAGTIAAGGDLGTLVAGGGGSAVKNFGVGAAGYGVCAANNQLFTFGGQGGAPAKNSKSVKLATPQPGMSGAWNDEGLAMIDPLYLEGAAVQNAFIFLLGGQTASAPAIVVTKNTETVIW